MADRGRKILRWQQDGGSDAKVETLVEALLSTRGDASGVALTQAFLERWQVMGEEEQREWFLNLAQGVGSNAEELNRAILLWQQDPSPSHASLLHHAAESLRQELFRRMNMAPGGTAALVRRRAALLPQIRLNPSLVPVDSDFEHLFTSWFNRGFLLLKRIDWSSPAEILEKIIRYEAVHEIHCWEDLRGRIKPADRRFFDFFHPQMPDEPLVFV